MTETSKSKTGSDTKSPADFRLDSEFQTHADPNDFKDAMASLAATACIVTAKASDVRLGRTVTAVFSLAASPPSILVSVKAGSHLADAIRQVGGFSIATLSEAQHDLADAFAGGLPAEKRFDMGEWEEWPSGHPRLRGAVSAMDCALIGTADTGDHLLFAGGVVAIDSAHHRKPLIWHQRAYSRVSPHGAPDAASR
ncbi:flavin reductase family protein [Methyloligella sp. 2.7D]|uniref:flavin reductase family protein n=1 Tax=unclassified Methyloligella TaxID=2625955 RepID=UPI00157C6637|nr:flavin reductase family protein [Methyloligella sp. GL2]QKP76352.1 flavin reductase [Methyloligella sp. GL2]